MTLEKFEEAMGVAARTAGRWERGTVLPSRAANGLLWVAEQHPEVFLEYAAQRAGGFRPVVEGTVVGTIEGTGSRADTGVVFKAKALRSKTLVTRLGHSEERQVVSQDKERVYA